MPITTNSTFRDNTMLSSYKTCPRSFQLRHVLNLVPDRVGIPLIFGQCWHAAMDIVWQEAKNFSKADLRKYNVIARFFVVAQPSIFCVRCLPGLRC